MRWQNNVNGEKCCGDGKTDLDWVDVGHGGEAEDDRREDDEANVEEDWNAQDECGDDHCGDDAFAAEFAGEVLGKGGSTTGFFNDLAQHGAKAHHHGDGAKCFAHTAGDHTHGLGQRDAGEHCRG